MADASHPAASLAELRERIDAIEAAYEFLLAYAAQGLEGDEGSGAGPELRRHLERMDGALGELEEGVSRVAEDLGLGPAARFQAFSEVLAEDARKAGAAVRLVASRPSVSSQLVDNLNASIHLRALLTDLFVLDEALKGSW